MYRTCVQFIYNSITTNQLAIHGYIKIYKITYNLFINGCTLFLRGPNLSLCVLYMPNVYRERYEM